MYLQFSQSVYAIPLEAAQLLPGIPAGGFQTEQEVASVARRPVSRSVSNRCFQRLM